MRFFLLLLLVGNLAFAIDDILAGLPPPGASYLDSGQLANLRFRARDQAGTGEVLPAAEEGAPHSYRFTVARKTDNPWDVGFGWTTPAGVGPERDDVMLVSFEARSVGTDEDAQGQVQVVLRRSVPPNQPALVETCIFGSEWQRFNLAASPEADMAGDGILLTFNLGLAPQEIEIRDVRLLNFGTSIHWAHFLRALDASPWRTGRRSAGRALDPGLLWEMLAYAELEATPADFSPDGAWQATYAIFHCQGYLLFNNANLGLLQLARIPQADGNFLLQATQSIRLAYAMLHVTEARAVCRADALATPLSWSFSSRFFCPEGEEIPDLSTDEEGAPAGGAGPVALDWGLFEAVQRLDPAQPLPVFSLVEGFDLVKPNQQVLFRGEESYRLGEKTASFRRFDQLGSGLLPVSYWLDGRGRLQIVATHNRAYILDPEAEAKFERYSQEQIARQRRIERRLQEAEDR